MKIDVREVFKEPVKRAALPKALGCENDREARRIIAELQKEYNIINLQDGKGYFLADDETALRYGMQERKRAASAFKKAYKIISRCSPPKTGIKVPVRAHFRTIGKKNDVNKNQMSLDETEER